MKTKLTVVIVFGALLALALAGGVYLALNTRAQYRGLLDERGELRTGIASFEAVVAGWQTKLRDTTMMEVTIDNLQGTLAANRLDFTKVLTDKGPLLRSPKMEIADSVESNNWLVYPLTLSVEGRPQAIDSFLNKLHADLPSLHIDQLDGTAKKTSTRLIATGSIRFPLED